MALHLNPGDRVWVRATVRESFPGEAYVRLEFAFNSVCVDERDVTATEPRQGKTSWAALVATAKALLSKARAGIFSTIQRRRAAAGTRPATATTTRAGWPRVADAPSAASL